MFKPILYSILTAALLVGTAHAQVQKPVLQTQGAVTTPLSQSRFNAATARQKLPPTLVRWGHDRIKRPPGTASALWSELEQAVRRQPDIDLSRMPIEDAVMYLFMVMQEDSQQDVRQMLDEMEAIRKQKEAARMAAERSKKSRDAARSKAVKGDGDSDKK